MTKSFVAGIEVSADQLLVAFAERTASQPKLKGVDNSAKGHRQLVRWLSSAEGSTQVVLESTGVYGLDAALALDAAGIEVMQANPRAVRDFAKACMIRQKTDDSDARVLLEFARRMPFKRWIRPSDQALQLRLSTRRIEQLKEVVVAEKNRRHAMKKVEATPPELLEASDQLIAMLEQQIEQLRQLCRSIIAQDEGLSRRYELLVSVRGIGDKSALTLLGELAVLAEDLTPKQWVALAGLAPRRAQSGRSVDQQRGVGKAGNKYLKKGLFMPALAASRFIPDLADFHQRLISRGLTPLQSVVAVMRKLLHLIHALFRDDRPFQLQPPRREDCLTRN